MCGICGIVTSTQLSEHDKMLTASMSQAFAHREPDEEGMFGMLFAQ